jgi:hypothetical protein
MIDTRLVGQEIQDQVLAAARKGQQRVNSTVKQVTATAALIRPQLPSLPRPTLPRPTLSGLPRPTLPRPTLPRPTLNIPGLLTPAQLREKAPGLAAMLPSTDQLKAGAHELAGQFLSVQRMVVDQVRSVATPLAQQAAAVFAQVGVPTAKTAPAQISDDADTEHAKADHAKADHAKAADHGKTAAHGKSAAHAKTAADGKAAAHGNGAGARKPRTKAAAK